MTSEAQKIPVVRRSAVTGKETVAAEVTEDEAEDELKRLRHFYPHTDELYVDYGRTADDVKAGRP
jgi:hypothetical protein